jgi:hypothetical protein
MSTLRSRPAVAALTAGRDDAEPGALAGGHASQGARHAVTADGDHYLAEPRCAGSDVPRIVQAGRLGHLIPGGGSVK